MVGFKLSEEQIALQTVCREFAQKELKPIALERDAITDPAKCFTWEVLDKAAKIGLKTLTVKKEYGGAEKGALDMVILGEELAAGDMSYGAIIIHSWWKVPYALQRVCTQEQIKEYLIPYILNNPRGAGALAACEPDVGCDTFLPIDDPKAGIKLSAVKDGNEIVLNGMKHFITMGPEASLSLVFARTDKTVPFRRGLTCFLVPRDTPGLSIGNVHDKMGTRGCPDSELIFDNVRLPAKAQIGAWNQAMIQVTPMAIAASNATTAAWMLGPARAAFEMALEYARQRVQGGKIIFNHQAVQLRLGEIWTNLHAARLVIWHACATWDNLVETGFKDPIDPKIFKAPKLFTSEVATQAVLEAQLMMGGLGVMRDVGMEKLVRDVLTLRHGDATDDVLRMAIALAL